jgi:hypothetical protein
MSETHIRVAVRGRTGPLSAATVTCGVLALYFLAEAFEPFSWFRLFLGIATAALAARLAVRGTLIAGKDVIEWRTMMRTRRWPYESVHDFDLALRPGQAPGSARRVVRIHLVDGRAQWLHGLEERPDPPVRLRWPWGRAEADPSDDDDALYSQLDALNRVLAGMRIGRTEREAG